MELPKNEAVFEINTVGDTTFKHYQGQFTVRCILSIGQKHAMELENSRLLGNYANPTGQLKGYATVLSTLRSKIIDAPEWWKQSLGGANINDENVLVDIFDEIEKAETEWRQKVKDLANPSADSQSTSA